MDFSRGGPLWDPKLSGNLFFVNKFVPRWEGGSFRMGSAPSPDPQLDLHLRVAGIAFLQDVPDVRKGHQHLKQSCHSDR